MRPPRVRQARPALGDTAVDPRLDAWPPLAKAGVRASLTPPAAFVEPTSVDEVCELVRHFSAAGIPIVPVGGASNVVGALSSSRAAAYLSLRGLDRILSVDTQNCVVTCEAGVLGGVLEASLQQAGLTLGHYPQSLHQSTVGGWIATRAMGTFSGRYGGIEALLLAIDVVLADGTRVQVPAAPRFAAGPPLAHLFLGAEGTLGVVVGASFRVVRAPASRRVVGWAVPTLGPALETLRELLHGGIHPAVVRLYDADDGASLVQQGGGPKGWLALLVGFDGHPEIVAQEIRVVERAVAALGARELPGVGEAWLERRFDSPAFLHAGERLGELGDAIDVTAWWSNLESSYYALREAVLKVDGSSCRAHFSHFYAQGASIYFIVGLSAPDDATAVERYAMIWEAAMRTCQQLEIAPVHHHGIGEVRRLWVRAYLGSSEKLLDRLRQAFDPQHLLNPDRLGGGSAAILPLAAQMEGHPL